MPAAGIVDPGGQVILSACFNSSSVIEDAKRWTNGGGDTGQAQTIDSTVLVLLTGAGTDRVSYIWQTQNISHRDVGILALCESSTSSSNVASIFTVRAASTTFQANLPLPNSSYGFSFSTSTGNTGIYRMAGTTFSNLGAVASGLGALANGTKYWLRCEAVGDQLKSKVWLHGSREPGWINTKVDTTNLAPGRLAIAASTGVASIGTVAIHQYTAYIPAPSNVVSDIILRGSPATVRAMAAEVDTATDAEATIRKTARYLVKPNSSTSFKATPSFSRGLLSPVSAAITINSALSIGGNVSFAAVISETKNLRLHRVAPSEVSGLSRSYQSAVPASTMVRPVLRRTVRRTGKMATSTSGRATISYRKLFTVVGSLNKPRFAISAKAVLSTTTTAQGNAPAIPPTLPNGVPASAMIGTGNLKGGIGLGMTGTQSWPTHKSKGWAGFAAPIMDNHGPSRGKNSSAYTEPINTTWAWQRAMEGWQEGGVNISGSGSQTAPNNNLGTRNVMAADPSFRSYLSVDIDHMVNWFDDAEAAILANRWGERAAACVYLGIRGFYTDTEFEQWGLPETDCPPGTTRVQALTKIEQRGYEVGLKVYAANPAISWNCYSPVPSGTVFDRIYNSPTGNGQSTGTTGNRDATNGGVATGDSTSQAFYCWMLGIMKAGAELGSTGTLSTLDHRMGYRGDGLRAGSPTIRVIDTAAEYMHASWMGMISRFSADMAPNVRDHWMGKIHYKCFSWSDTSCLGSNPPVTDYYCKTRQSATVYNSYQTLFRAWNGEGERWEYMYNDGHPNKPTAPCGNWAAYANPYDAVPGRTAHYLQMALTTPQDVMTVPGGPPVGGDLTVTAVGRGANPTATVPLELTATLTNNTLGPINNPGVGFYTVPGNVNVGWAASNGIVLPAGQSMSFSTLTSPGHSQYTPSAAGTVTLRAKPGDNGVDSDTGTRDQTFTVAAAPPPPPSGARPFTSTSSWNTPVPTGATFTDRPELRTSNWWFDASDFGIVVYTSTPSDPLVTVSIPFNSWNWPISSTQIRIASGVDGAEGSDGTLCVVSGTDVWDFWQFNRLSDTTAECSASAHTSITTGTGWSLGGGQAAGIRSAGCSSLAGLIQGNTLTNGFDHALAVALRFELVSGATVRDAISSDGQGGPGAIPMGTRLAIPPNVPRPGSVTSSIAINIWNACKTYGVYVVDTMGGGTVGGFAGNVNTVTTAQSDLLLNAGVWNSPELTAIGHALQLVNL